MLYLILNQVLVVIHIFVPYGCTTSCATRGAQSQLHAACAKFILHVRGTKMSTEERFKEYLDSKFPVDEKRTRSAIIHRSYGERIVRHLKGTPA